MVFFCLTTALLQLLIVPIMINESLSCSINNSMQLKVDLKLPKFIVVQDNILNTNE